MKSFPLFLVLAVACNQPAVTQSVRKPRFVLYHATYDNGLSSSAVSLLETLDEQTLDYSLDLQLPGEGSVTTYGEWIFVASGDAALITRYRINADGGFQEDQKLSVAESGQSYIALYPGANTFVNEDKAYLLNGETGEHLIWSPREMKILGKIEAPESIREEIATSDYTVSGEPIIRGNALLRIFLIAKDGEERQYLVGLDTATDTFTSVVEETRCLPLVGPVSKDENGTSYLTNWISVAGAPHCVLRMGAEERVFDPNWQLDYATLTQGLEGGMFTYVGNGQGLMAIFHPELVPADAAADEIEALPAWKLWRVDMASETATEVAGIAPASGLFPGVFDGRAYVMASQAGLISTLIYEVPPSGDAQERFEVTGYCVEGDLLALGRER